MIKTTDIIRRWLEVAAHIVILCGPFIFMAIAYSTSFPSGGKPEPAQIISTFTQHIPRGYVIASTNARTDLDYPQTYELVHTFKTNTGGAWFLHLRDTSSRRKFIIEIAKVRLIQRSNAYIYP